jgi:hypothetical protein
MLNRLGMQAATRSPTGPGQHDMTYLPNQDIIIDVTARQFGNHPNATANPSNSILSRNDADRRLDKNGV